MQKFLPSFLTTRRLFQKVHHQTLPGGTRPVTSLGPWTSAEIFPGGATSTFRLFFFRVRTVQCKWTFKMAWSRRFIPRLFVWHSSKDVVRMKWRYYRAGLYTKEKKTHWLKQWPIRKGLGDKKRRVVIGWRCNLDLVKTLEQSTNGKFKRFRRSSRSKRIFLFAEKRIQRFDESRFQGGEREREFIGANIKQFHTN